MIAENVKMILRELPDRVELVAAAKEKTAEHILEAIQAGVKIMRLMTMGPRFGNPEDSRPYFKEKKRRFEQIKKMDLPNVEMKYLSMEMTNSIRLL